MKMLWAVMAAVLLAGCGRQNANRSTDEPQEPGARAGSRVTEKGATVDEDGRVKFDVEVDLQPGERKSE